VKKKEGRSLSTARQLSTRFYFVALANQSKRKKRKGKGEKLERGRGRKGKKGERNSVETVAPSLWSIHTLRMMFALNRGGGKGKGGEQKEKKKEKGEVNKRCTRSGSLSYFAVRPSFRARRKKKEGRSRKGKKKLEISLLTFIIFFRTGFPLHEGKSARKKRKKRRREEGNALRWLFFSLLLLCVRGDVVERKRKKRRGKKGGGRGEN